MREDFFKSVDRGNRYKLNGPSGYRPGAGGFIKPCSIVSIPTKIDGVSYNFDYLVVTERSLPSLVLLADPLLDFAKIELRQKGPLITPLVGHSYIQLIQDEADDVISAEIQRVPEE